MVISGLLCNKPVEFIVDSGAEKSVLPISLVPDCLCVPTDIELAGLDGRPLKVYGHFNGKLGIKSLRREFCINFIITDTKPILGADFLTEYGLSLNMQNKQLANPLTGISAKLTSSQCTKPIFTITHQTMNTFISTNFPNLLKAPDYSSLPSNTSITHEIKTCGQPVFSKARSLESEKYKLVKEKFDKEGIEIPFPYRTIVMKNIIPLLLHNKIVLVQCLHCYC